LTYDDPLKQLYEDLAFGKTDTHFDEVLKLSGFAKEAFTDAVHGYKTSYLNNPKTERTHHHDKTARSKI